MSSPNPRIQVCADPILYSQIKTLAKGRNQTLSTVVQALCNDALQTDEIRAEYQQACDIYGEVPVQPDNRKRSPGRPHFKTYAEGESPADQIAEGNTTGLTPRQQRDLYLRKKAAIKGGNQEEADTITNAAQQTTSGSKKEALKELLMELLTED
jgi:hypothetical protein